jgi:predicted lipid-binding transport protein (Tim44 family)
METLNIDLSTLVFLALAIAVAWRLRSVLGRRTDEDRARYERSKAEQAERARHAEAQTQPQSSDKVVQLPRRSGQPEAAPMTGEERFREDAEQAIRRFAGKNEALADKLLTLHRADSSFEPQGFLEGARQAYEMIVTAFAGGDRKTLRPLLASEVYDGFAGVMDEREARGERVEQSFIGIERVDLLDAEVKGSMAHVTVKFVSELISATLDKAGEIVAGDTKRINEVTDIWTFARDIGSRDPNWKLIATEAAH